MMSLSRLAQLAGVVGVLAGLSTCSVDGVTFRSPGQPAVEDCAVDGDEDGNGAADCDDLACAAAPACMVAMPATCTDGRKNGDESDVDCGGACPRCDDAAACAQNGDCASGLCGGGACVRASSCREILERGFSTGDGAYSIDLDGRESAPPFAVKCDMTIDGGGWTRFNWITAGAYPANTDPLGQLLSECAIGAALCRGRIPTSVNPTHFMVKDVAEGNRAIWQFDATNAVSNAALAAFRDKVVGCVANGPAPWQPTSHNSNEDFCGAGSGGTGCDSFTYADQAGTGPGCAQVYSGWYTQMDEDTGCYRTAFKMGMTHTGYETRACLIPESNFLDDGATDDDTFGELYYR
jgi:hypothetical protein